MNSLKKDLALIFGLFLLIAVMLVFGKGFTSGSFLGPTYPGQSPLPTLKGNVPLNIRDLSISAQVASSAADKRKGLSKRDSLPISEGMLFVFEQKGLYAIWMKDMRFPIDIIWINEDKSVIHIVESAAPEPGKVDKELTVYKPTSDAKYILEINAGLVKHHNLQIGDKVSF